MQYSKNSKEQYWTKRLKKHFWYRVMLKDADNGHRCQRRRRSNTVVRVVYIR